MGLVLLLTYVAITHDSDHDPRQPDRPMVPGQQMREVSSPPAKGSFANLSVLSYIFHDRLQDSLWLDIPIYRIRGLRRYSALAPNRHLRNFRAE